MSKQLLQNIHHAHERNKNSADPIALTKANHDMRPACRPMPAIRFQAYDLAVSNGSPSEPFGYALFNQMRPLVRPFGTIPRHSRTDLDTFQNLTHSRHESLR